MFVSWVDGLIFGIIATFITGVITSVVARADLNSFNSNKNA